MSRTTLSEVTQQIQKFWSPMFSKELREDTLLASLVNKDYQGEIKKGGDTVYVSQVDAPSGEILDVGTNADSFTPESMVTQRISVTANKRIVASYEFDDLVDLQSQIHQEHSDIRSSLMFALEKQLNDYLYNQVAPSASTPDHDIGSVADFNAAQLRAIRLLASQAKWRRDKPWYLLADPSYYNDLLADSTLASSDFGSGKAPTIAGQIAAPRYGFNILEDNSRATDYALAFSPDFLHLVMQQNVRFKISDQHSNNRFGYVISADLIVGSALGIDGDVKHIRIQSA